MRSATTNKDPLESRENTAKGRLATAEDGQSVVHPAEVQGIYACELAGQRGLSWAVTVAPPATDIDAEVIEAEAQHPRGADGQRYAQ